MQYLFKNNIIVVRGGGDLATGVVQTLSNAGFKVLVLETDKPTAIRRTVAICEAVYNEDVYIENIHCRRVGSLAEIDECFEKGTVPLLVDSSGDAIATLRPFAVVDAILAKKNLGTNRQMAPVTIGLGPGFTAGIDVDAVIETMRGHNLGRCILDGTALPNTGIPGEIGGQSALRVIHAPRAGTVTPHCRIGDIIKKGEALLSVGGQIVTAPFSGLVRGLIRGGLYVPHGMKIADIDPRTDVNWHTISDKARCLGGSVLQTVLYLANRQNPSPLVWQNR